MNDVTHRWAEEVKDSVVVLKKIRDEAKVQARLATLDAKARFSEVRKSLSGLAANLRTFKAEIVRAARRSA
jgi:hypothetical protein